MSTELLKSIEETERQLENLKKQLEESRNGSELWKPAYGREYFSFAGLGKILRFIWVGDPSDKEVHARHNVFPSRSVAEKAAELMRHSNLIISACLQVEPDFQPDWRNPNQIKWFPRYDHTSQKWEPICTYSYQEAVACVSSKEALQKVFKILEANG